MRVGNTVRRPLHPWSTTVHAWLQHLEQPMIDGTSRSGASMELVAGFALQHWIVEESSARAAGTEVVAE